MPRSASLNIGSLVYDDVDQIDVTGPFEVLSRTPDSTHRIFAAGSSPVRDVQGLRIVPDARLEEAPQLDVLHVPGGPGQEALMDDERLMQWLRGQAGGARMLFSVCTGALLCGAAGLLVGRRATTHWAALHLLPFYGAEAIDERVVVDGTVMSTGGVTAGIDGALRLVADLRGREAAERVQLAIAYAPEPPFDSGSPGSAPAGVLEAVRQELHGLTERREMTARRFADQLGLAGPGH